MSQLKYSFIALFLLLLISSCKEDEPVTPVSELLIASWALEEHTEDGVVTAIEESYNDYEFRADSMVTVFNRDNMDNLISTFEVDYELIGNDLIEIPSESISLDIVSLDETTLILSFTKNDVFNPGLLIEVQDTYLKQ